jgi:adenylate cyclase
MSTHRKLAAILSADVAGYSRLMAGDEVATIRSLNDARALDRERIENHSGRKHSGDFGSASFRFV